MRQPQRARTRPRQNRPLRRACSGTIRRPPGCMDRPILTCHWRPRHPAHARIKRGQDGGSIKPPDRGHRRQMSPGQTGSAARAACTGPQVRLQRLHQKALPSAHIFHIFGIPQVSRQLVGGTESAGWPRMQASRQPCHATSRQKRQSRAGATPPRNPTATNEPCSRQ